MKPIPPAPSGRDCKGPNRKPRVQLLVNIVVLGSIYALIACGYVLIYQVSRVLNLAHGELMMLGAYLLLTTAWLFRGEPVLALAAAILLSLVVGALVYVFLMRKMTGEMVLAAILATVALGILIRGGVVLVWSAQQQYPAQALGVSNPTLALTAGARISLWSGMLVAANAAVYAALFFFLRFGRWGMRMRAAGQSPLLAAQRGINLHGIYALAWSLSTFTGALAGILMALDSGLTTSMPIIGMPSPARASATMRRLRRGTPGKRDRARRARQLRERPRARLQKRRGSRVRRGFGSMPSPARSRCGSTRWRAGPT